MLQGAGIARFHQALVERIHRHAQVIEKNPTYEREREVAAGLRKFAAQLRTVHKSCRIKKHGGPKQRLHGIHHEWDAICFRDHQVSPEIEPQFTPVLHCGRSLWSRCSKPSNKFAEPVSWKNACSRLAVLVRASKPGTVSNAASWPWWITATRCASCSISESACEAKSKEVLAPRKTSVDRKRRNPAAAMASRLRVGSSSSNTVGLWSNALARLRRCVVPEDSVRTC